jgi:hypothetical protein
MSAEADKISARQFGLALVFFTPLRSGKGGCWLVKFDTGIDLYVPERLFKIMEFELPEADPQTPKGTA